jgi:hypothetical protein
MVAAGIEDRVTPIIQTSSATGGGTPTYEYAKPYVITVVNGNSYTITASSTANATTTGGGAGADYSYDISIGYADGGESGGGYGGGSYGGGLYGVGDSTTTSPVRPRLWSLAAWGEDLIANICGAGIYLWDASAASTRAATLTNAPARCNAIVVTPQRSILALGCTSTGSNFDPLIIRPRSPAPRRPSSSPPGSRPCWPRASSCG